MLVNEFKSLIEDLEIFARQQAQLDKNEKLQPADQLILKTWNALPVTYDTLQS